MWTNAASRTLRSAFICVHLRLNLFFSPRFSPCARVSTTKSVFIGVHRWLTPSSPRTKRRSQRGSALLTVLWLSAALATIGFALASTVRSETDRTATELDGLRSYYLATGAIHRAYLELLWSVLNPAKRPIPQGSVFVDYAFPSGNVRVEFIPEAAKLDVNFVPVQDLFRLITALGIDPERAQVIATAIEDWRRPAHDGSPFDPYYLSLVPSFRPRHASLEEIEELLLVKGVTPDIFYGTWTPRPESASSDGPEGASPRLVPHNGLADCLSVFGARDRVDINTAPPAVLAAVGLTPYAVSAIVQRRRMAPITQQQLGPFMQGLGADASRLRVEGNSIVTIRATAQLRLANGQFSDLKRTVAAQVKYMPPGYDSPIHILRWYDTAWSF